MYQDDGYRNRKFAPAYAPAPRQIVARFASKCAECGGAIEAGEAILYAPGQYKARVTHVSCPTPEPVTPAPAPVVVLSGSTFSFDALAYEVADLQVMLAETAAGFTAEQLERAYLSEAYDDLLIRAVLDAELDARNEAEWDASLSAKPLMALAPVVTVFADGSDDYTGEDDLTERAIEARNDEWASRETALDEAHLAPAPAPAPVVAPVASPEAQGPARIAVEDAGVYALPDGTVVRVKANREKTRTYASRWTPTKHLDRLMEAGAHEHGEYVYEQGLVAEVARTGRKLTLEEAKAHSIRYGQCVRCGRALKDGKSVEQGMGPVCIKYFQG